MQQHLDNGCKQCKTTMDLWQSVLAIAEQESVLTPPADVVRVVKSQFAALAPEVSRGVRLVFDSILQPATAGVRSSVSARQFLFETDDYYIDLRLEPRTAEDRRFLIGQVLNRIGKQAAQGVSVRLREGKEAIAETATNQFGEFQLEFGGSGTVSLAIGRDQQEEAIVLPLYGVSPKPFKTRALD